MVGHYVCPQERHIWEGGVCKPGKLHYIIEVQVGGAMQNQRSGMIPGKRAKHGAPILCKRFIKQIGAVLCANCIGHV